MGIKKYISNSYSKTQPKLSQYKKKYRKSSEVIQGFRDRNKPEKAFDIKGSTLIGQS